MHAEHVPMNPKQSSFSEGLVDGADVHHPWVNECGLYRLEIQFLERVNICF